MLFHGCLQKELHRKCPRGLETSASRPQRQQHYSPQAFSRIPFAAACIDLTVRLHIENNLVVCTCGSNMTHTKSLFSHAILKV